ncbi:hypothetical protein EDB19DRAFT_1915657 [Suillus lakei]|nr:hypothetical protein EDB19DRAFT_1915657 [Suillus lakei]
MAHAELDYLQTCLNFALDTFRKEMDKSQLPPLSQHSSVEHPLDDPTTYLPSTALFEARRLSLACLGELKNLIQPPLDKRMDEKYTAYGAACVDTLIKTSIIDYLSDVPNPFEGVPAIELASKFELDSQKLVPILRCCAANGWVRETRDSSFALSRCSRTFVKGHAGRRMNLSTPAVMSMIGVIPQLSDGIGLETIAFSSADRLPDRIQDSPCRDSPGLCRIQRPSFQWRIIFKHPSLQVIMQDTENVAALTNSIMAERRPHNVESGALKVEAHDFFQPQPRIGNEYSFILLLCTKGMIGLTKSARALGHKSKLLIIDMVAVPNVDATATTSAKSFLPDSDDKHPDASIPSHFGSASKLVNGFSVHMLTLMNGCERSLHEWETLVKGCGLCITNVYPLRAHTSIIECALDTRILL